MPWTKEVRAEQLDATDGGSTLRYLALFVGAPLSGGVEVTGPGYSRAAVTVGPANASTAPVDRVSTNDATWTMTGNGGSTGVTFLAVYASDNSTFLGQMVLPDAPPDGYDLSVAGASAVLRAGEYIERQP